MDHFNNLQFSEIISYNKTNIGSAEKNTKIGILRNITVDNYLPFIKYLFINAGINPNIQMGDYDVVIQEVISKDTSLFNFKPDLLIIFLDVRILSPNLIYKYSELSGDEINKEKETILEYFQMLFNSINYNFATKVIFHLFELPSNPAFDIAEIQNGEGQRKIIQSLNDSIIEIAKHYDDIFFVNLNIIKEKLGIQNYFDKRYWFIAKSPFSLDAAKEIAVEHWKIINALNGKTKKCLVLDCDNTLWGGILGEDGFDKIKIGKTYPGNMYLDFQRQVLNLYNKGVILAINSKNNEADVLEIFENHPDMLLRKKHFACIYANWENKADNIKNIALDLNIGTDSLVFVDDSEFECNLVKEKIPEVEVINLPKEAYKYSEILLNCGLFDKLSYTQEDKNRGELYKVEVDRKNHRTKFIDIDSYYKSLEMVITIESVNEFTIPRVSQLTQRTNQFNLTTKRYSEDEIRYFMNSKNHNVLVLSLSDKFGDMGIVGVLILDYTVPDLSIIDSLMMSCRVIGRQVENIFIHEALNRSFNRKIKKVLGKYIPTKKNSQVANFYISNGFQLVSTVETGTTYELCNFEEVGFKENNFKEIIVK